MSTTCFNGELTKIILPVSRNTHLKLASELGIFIAGEFINPLNSIDHFLHCFSHLSSLIISKIKKKLTKYRNDPKFSDR